MLDFQIDNETKELLRKFVQELGLLNEHFSDIKEIVAPMMGFRVVKKLTKIEQTLKDKGADGIKKKKTNV